MQLSSRRKVLVVLTKEQEDILKSGEKRKVVQASAGSGKTSTLLEIIKKNENKKHLLLCFNASIRKEIKEKLENRRIYNAEVHTFHSFAHNYFSKAGFEIISDFSRRELVSEFDYFFVKNFLKENSDRGYSDQEILTFKKILESFFISRESFSVFFEKNPWKVDFGKFMSRIKDDRTMPITHSFYIKIFQIIKFKTKVFDCVLVDESQDTNECYFAIVENLECEEEFFVGDGFQKIYGYNGALGITEKMGKVYPMSKSFRVGSEVAWLSNYLIKKFTKVDFGMKGVNANQKICENLPVGEQKTIIFRTNLALIERLHAESKNGKFCAIVGGSDSLNLFTIKKIFGIFKGIPYYYLDKVKVESYQELVHLQHKTEDMFLKRVINLIQYYKHDLPEVIETIESRLVSEIEHADIVFVTTHKSKGMEFKNVEISDDFKTLEELETSLCKGEDVSDEIFVMYVAITRGYGKVKLNRDLQELYGELNSAGREKRRIK